MRQTALIFVALLSLGACKPASEPEPTASAVPSVPIPVAPGADLHDQALWQRVFSAWRFVPVRNADGSPNTAHTTNLVPCILVDNDYAGALADGKLGDLAPTILELMGVPHPPEMTGQSLLRPKATVVA